MAVKTGHESLLQGNATLEDAGKYLVYKNVDVPLAPGKDGALIRVNVYLPKGGDKYPVLATYGPYGKDIPYADFHPKSYSEINPNQKSKHSAWEVPDPEFWTSHNYAIVRADERGTGQSPGLLDTMSVGTSECFFDVIEWAASQPWSIGRVGLLGISYYAGTQWRVAARRPKGLAAIIPWEGMSDYYRDRVRHGGILSNTFIARWWNRQVITNQYGLPGRRDRKWGEDTLEGDLDSETLARNRRDQTVDTAKYRFRDDEYFASKDYRLEDIEVPLLSVANWGGISLHLRGNIEGYRWAGSKVKYLRCIVGRHDLPFYYDEEVEIQKSFLDAFLKGEDTRGWTVPGKIPAVEMVVRNGEPPHNNPPLERAIFPRRSENEWPIARTKYEKWYLTPDREISPLQLPSDKQEGVQIAQPLRYEAPGGLIQFKTQPFSEAIEITGHPVLHINASISARGERPPPSELDVFVTLRHINSEGNEVFYTGTSGDPVPIVKGWLRASLRAIDESHPHHRHYTPYRTYESRDVQPVTPGVIYPLDIEIWPTNVVIERGGRLILEISSSDTQGAGFFEHNHPADRSDEKLFGWNSLHFGPGSESYLTLPIIPSKE